MGSVRWCVVLNDTVVAAVKLALRSRENGRRQLFLEGIFVDGALDNHHGKWAMNSDGSDGVEARSLSQDFHVWDLICTVCPENIVLSVARSVGLPMFFIHVHYVDAAEVLILLRPDQPLLFLLRCEAWFCAVDDKDASLQLSACSAPSRG